MMKIIKLFILTCIAFCCKESNTSFITNISWDKISEKHQPYIQSKSLNFIYINHGGGDMPESYSKIFSIKNGECRKIEFTKAKNVMDTLSKTKVTHYIKKETVLSRFCNTEETKLFLEKIEDLNIYELPEEEILINKCIE